MVTPLPEPTPVKEVEKNVDLEMIGWLPYWDEENSLNQLKNSVHHLEYFSPILYKIDSDGTLAEIYVKNRKEMLRLAKDNDVPVVPVLSDEFDYPRVTKLLSNPLVQEEFIRELIDEGKKNHFAGWSVDIETIRHTDREKFTKFVENVSTNLHKHDMEFHVIVYAKDRETRNEPSASQDLKKLGQIADKIIPMVYGYSNDSTRPGGQAPLAWYRKILQYSVENVPVDKLGIGLSTHGYKWGGRKIEGISYPMIQDLIAKYDTEVFYSKQSSSAITSYEDNKTQYVIWFEDAKTIDEKIRIAQKEFGIHTFAIWRIGAMDLATWDKVKALEITSDNKL
jgi:spore germination protein